MRPDDVASVTTPGVTVTKLGFLSFDGVTQIKALMWSPSAGKSSTPRGIIQIAHGMEEHIGRYAAFADYLASLGYVVCAADMVGHGKSAPDPEKLGCLPSNDGVKILVEDANKLRKVIAERFSKKVPYFVFGHSMGSFLMLAYISRYGEGLAGAILSGSGQQPLLLSKLGGFFARRIAKSKGEDHKSAFLENLGAGSYAKKIKGARTRFDWISTDEAVVDAYSADPLSGVPFSAGGYITLTDLTALVAGTPNAAAIPKDLPILFISGALDPVGKNGALVVKSAEHLRDAGVKQVDIILYEGMRHEVLNEPEKNRVYLDITQWLESVLQR